MALFLSALGLMALGAMTSCASRTVPSDSPEDTRGELDMEEAQADDASSGEDAQEDAAMLLHREPLNPRSLVFEGACRPGERWTIAAVGDVLLHGRLQRQASRHEDRYRSLWSDLEGLFGAVDFVYANLEGPAARGVLYSGEEVRDPGVRYDGEVYSSYPRFNYHPAVIEDLKKSGVTVLSTANNHSLDRRSIGVDRTVEALEAAGMAYTGSRHSHHRKKKSSKPVRKEWHVVTEVRGLSVAWLACTFSTNGLPDYRDQILYCFDDREELLAQVSRLAGDSEIDAVIVTPHWGWEDTQNLRKRQKELAVALAEAGATAVLGGHPHVVQEWSRHVTRAGREVLIHYSLGNFVSGQSDMEQRASLVLLLGLTRDATGAVFVHGVRYLPLSFVRERSRWHVESIEDRSSERWQHVVERYGAYNLFESAELEDEPGFTLTPQCEPDWVPPREPHEHDGWIGGGCERAEDCGGGDSMRCRVELPGGFCELPCEHRCPEKRGRGHTFCVAWSQTQGLCAIRCRRDSDCRVGYVCREASRAGGAGRPGAGGKKPARRRVCLPPVLAEPSTPEG